MPLGSVGEVIRIVYELSAVDKGTQKLLASERAVQKETKQTAAALRQQDAALRRSASVAEQTSQREVRAARRVATSRRQATRGPGVVSRAAGSARGTVGAFVGGATAVTAGRLVASEYTEAARLQAVIAQGIKSTGGVANVTAGHIERMSAAMSRQAGVDDELIGKGASVLLTFTKIRNEVGEGNKIFDRANQAALDLSVRFGKDLTSSSIMVGKALNDPLKGLTALGRAGVQFTAQQRDQIKAMVESGNTLGAQRVILRELETQVGGTARAQAQPVDRLRVSVNNLAESVGTALAPSVERAADDAANFIDQMATGTGGGGRFAAQMRRVADDLEPVGKGIASVGKFLAAHPRLVVAAAGAYTAFRAARGVLRIANDLRVVGSAITAVARRAASTRLAVLLANGARGTAGRIGRLLAPVSGVVSSAMSAAADRGAAALASRARWNNAGRSAGKMFVRGFIVALPLLVWQFKDTINDLYKSFSRSGIGRILDAPGRLGDAIGSALGGLLGTRRRRTGGRITRMAVGGMVPILAAGGEVHVDGARAAVIPGDPRRDATLMFARPGSAVLTADGQARMMAGASLGEAITHQAPHFAKGGKVPGGRYVSTSYGPPWGGIQGTGVTATGVNLRRGPKVYGVAVDPRVIPLGSQLYANPNPFGRSGPFRAFDTGGAIKGNRIDFYDWRGRKRQNAWGRRSVRVSGVRIRGVGSGEAPEGDLTARVPITMGRSRSRAGLLQDAVEQGIAAGMAGLTRREANRAVSGARGARRNPIMEAIRGALTPTTREVTIPGAESGSSAGGAGGGTPRMRKMTAFAARASAKWPKYVYGGGHAGFGGPYDCSGYVSAILHAGGFLGRPMTTDGFKSWGRKGDGRRITVGVRGSTGRNAHMMMRIGSSYWEAGRGGVGRRGGWSGSFPIRRHPAGYRRGGLVGDMSVMPSRIAQLLLNDPRALDPDSASFVGYGLRRGGIVGMQRGGRVGGRLGSALRGAMTFRGGSLDALDAAIGGAVEARLEVLRREVLRRVRRGGSKKTVQRLQSVIDLVDFELGRRIGRYQDVVEQRSAAIDRAQQMSERGLRLAGVDASSPLGVAVVARGQAAETGARAQNLQQLQRALTIARRTGNREVIRDVTERYREAQDALAESLVRQVELWRDQLRAITEEVSARAQFATGLAGAGGSILEAWQRTAGVQDTAGAMQQRAAYTTGVTIPALRAQQQAAHLAQITAAAAGDLNGWRAAVQDAANAAVEIANAQADAADLMRQAAMRAAQDVVDAAGHGRTMADLGLQRLALEQQLIGTHDTGGGAVGRADFIRSAIIPAIQGEVAALQVQLAAAQATGDKALATQIAEAIYAKENDVLEAQLAAQNAIKENTDAMREQGGSTAFSYQSQTFTDLDAIRARVGA